MFEFEDKDFAENLLLPIGEDGYGYFETPNAVQLTYIGDGVWVVDTQETDARIAHVKSGISE